MREGPLQNMAEAAAQPCCHGKRNEPRNRGGHEPKSPIDLPLPFALACAPPPPNAICIAMPPLPAVILTL